MDIRPIEGYCYIYRTFGSSQNASILYPYMLFFGHPRRRFSASVVPTPVGVKFPRLSPQSAVALLSHWFRIPDIGQPRIRSPGVLSHIRG